MKFVEVDVKTHYENGKVVFNSEDINSIVKSLSGEKKTENIKSELEVVGVKTESLNLENTKIFKKNIINETLKSSKESEVRDTTPIKAVKTESLEHIKKIEAKDVISKNEAKAETIDTTSKIEPKVENNKEKCGKKVIQVGFMTKNSTITSSNLFENNYKDNTPIKKGDSIIQPNKLIISEERKKVYLPYTKEEIDYYMSSGEYSSESELIEDKYCVPLSNYLNPFGSRLLEGYRLMRNREKMSVIESFRFGMSLAFERKLHPAVITACDSRDELDDYISSMNGTSLNKFNKFEVVFKSNPLKV